MLQMYKHTALSTANSTRVLVLEPASNPTAPLHCSLEEVSLYSRSTLDYTALSYAWDAQTRTCPISCGNGVLLITSNCEAALRQLRHQHDAHRLWIDSICIDQTSLVERSQQVALMGDIYKRAELVLVWLGKGNDKVEVAIQRLKEIGELCVTINDKSEGKEAISNAALELLLGIEVRHESQDPLRPPWELSWFHRMWTVQEVTLPSIERVRVMYGTLAFPWMFFLLAVHFLRIVKYKFGRWNEATILQDSITTILQRKRDPESQQTTGAIDEAGLEPYQGILQILVAMRPKKATDPKDKVFALMGVLKELGLDLPLADYQRPLEQIYIETAVICIKSAGNLNVLYEAPSKHRRTGLPSWVPDWSDENSTSLEHKKYAVEMGYQAANHNTPQWSFLPDCKQLIVSGKIVDSVAASCDVLEYEMDFSLDLQGLTIGKTGFRDIMQRFQPPIAILREWVRVSSQYTIYPSGETAEDAFKNTLLVGGFVKEARTSSSESYREWLKFMETKEEDVLPSLRVKAKGEVNQPQSPIAERSDPQLRNNAHLKHSRDQTPHAAGMFSFMALSASTASAFHFEVLRKNRGKGFFATTNGYFGLAVGAKLKPGDRVALIPGLEVPVVLRPFGAGHELVTYCYIHGGVVGELWERMVSREDIVIV